MRGKNDKDDKCYSLNALTEIFVNVAQKSICT